MDSQARRSHFALRRNWPANATPRRSCGGRRRIFPENKPNRHSVIKYAPTRQPAANLDMQTYQIPGANLPRMPLICIGPDFRLVGLPTDGFLISGGPVLTFCLCRPPPLTLRLARSMCGYAFCWILKNCIATPSARVTIQPTLRAIRIATLADKQFERRRIITTNTIPYSARLSCCFCMSCHTLFNGPAGTCEFPGNLRFVITALYNLTYTWVPHIS